MNPTKPCFCTSWQRVSCRLGALSCRLGALLLFLKTVSLTVTGCTPDYVAKSRPVMYFKDPRGAALLIGGSGKARRIVIDGKPRLAPFVCPSEPMLFNTNGPAASVKEGMKKLAYGEGSRRVYIADKKGKIIARGRMCIFPTFKTKDSGALRGYRFHIPMEKLKKRPRHKSGVVFQTYDPIGTTEDSSRHVAWVLYLESSP